MIIFQQAVLKYTSLQNTACSLLGNQHEEGTRTNQEHWLKNTNELRESLLFVEVVIVERQ